MVLVGSDEIGSNHTDPSCVVAVDGEASRRRLRSWSSRRQPADLRRGDDRRAGHGRRRMALVVGGRGDSGSGDEGIVGAAVRDSRSGGEGILEAAARLR